MRCLKELIKEDIRGGTNRDCLLGESIQHENVVLLLSDAVPYMKKAAKVLKVIFPEMIHLTCLAHALHRIAEHARGLFPSVDKLVSNGKKRFFKAPS